MTYFDKLFASQIPTLDAALVWGITYLHSANTNQNNPVVNDPTSRETTRNSCKWKTYDTLTGDVYFSFDLTLFLLNDFPLENKENSLIDMIAPISQYRLSEYEWFVDVVTKSKGAVVGDIPDYIDTLERFLIWVIFRIRAIQFFVDSWNKIAAIGAPNDAGEITVSGRTRPLVQRFIDNSNNLDNLPALIFGEEAIYNNDDGINSTAEGDAAFFEGINFDSAIDDLFPDLAGRSLPSQVAPTSNQLIPVIKQCAESTSDAYGGDIVQELIAKNKKEK